ncbi:hypothetical protein QBC41DRAFT_18580 [Cercophora samala]|uniref:Transmembrane protein n=1 Tax=Cercophora samala TaxID=330535 RepID=A0AA40DF04_9PEZI|nr:hypothetical protein QBC41DRAFT_18580 [Cercophora samala]
MFTGSIWDFFCGGRDGLGGEAEEQLHGDMAMQNSWYLCRNLLFLLLVFAQENSLGGGFVWSMIWTTVRIWGSWLVLCIFFLLFRAVGFFSWEVNRSCLGRLLWDWELGLGVFACGFCGGGPAMEEMGTAGNG